VLETPPAVPFPQTPQGARIRDLVQSHVALFRFSAVTFNGHKIHYNRAWCREVEGHRECVVHGPLNLINMVDFWRDVIGQQMQEGEIDGQEGELVPERITYRATSPLYAGEKYRIILEGEKEKITEVRIVDGHGNESMRGMIGRF
jgi:hydroxyacyl-ACP dehydratase HTD2-like protein with hotdog domain